MCGGVILAVSKRGHGRRELPAAATAAVVVGVHLGEEDFELKVLLSMHDPRQTRF
jgi:hypothetical protein